MLEVKFLNIDIMRNYEALISLEKKFIITRSDIPELFVGNTALVGKDVIIEEAEKEIKNLAAKGGADWPGGFEARGGELVEERFESFTLLAVLSAGLIDGINPCAFATLVFFISFLTFIGRGKKEILIIGSLFTAAVFTTYLLIGFGVFRFLQIMELPFFATKIIYIAIGIVAFALGILNLYDYYRFKTGMITEMALQLPARVKGMIHGVIRMNKTAYGLPLFATAAATGFLVSILESICTGQIYLPTIVFIIKTQGLHPRAFTFLLLYNLMFVFPLIVIFGMAVFGVSSERFGEIMKRNIGVTKLLTALLFFGLGFVLFVI